MEAFIDRGVGFVQYAVITRVPTMYTELVQSPTKSLDEEKASLDVLVGEKGDSKRLKKIMKRTFHEECETGLYSLKSH